MSCFRRLSPTLLFVFLAFQVFAVFAAIAFTARAETPPLTVFRFGSVMDSDGPHWVYNLSKLTNEGVPLWQSSVDLTPEIAQEDRTEAARELRFVHKIYSEIAKNNTKRPVFTPDFLKTLKEEDLALPPERLFHYVIQSRDRILAVFGVFDGSLDSRSADPQLPVERKLRSRGSPVSLTARTDPKKKLIEIRRLAKDPTQTFADIELITKVISQHLIYAGLTDATLIVHTDWTAPHQLEGFPGSCMTGSRPWFLS